MKPYPVQQNYDLFDHIPLSVSNEFNTYLVSKSQK